MNKKEESNLYQELRELFTLNIPAPIKQEDSYLDITRQRFRETIISRIYAYYLDANNSATIATLFLSSLLELIGEEGIKEEFHFYNYDCTTEVLTNKGNRIDLLIRTTKYDEAIIIENKINHELNSDLTDYWGSVTSDKKICVLFSSLTVAYHQQ